MTGAGGGPSATVGPYRLEDRLGTGGMGEVWRAWDERLDRSVAVKLIRPESAGDRIARERFRREARAAAALTHPAIVRIYDIVESGEGDAIVMELVEGEPLSRRIARGPLPVTEAVRLGRQVAEGLAAAHRRGILHRDLKTENVIITPEGDAKILDFGLAKRMDGGAEASLTRSDGVVGTFRAMSPEQARGMTLDPRSDLFSFGVLLYEMLTGVSPLKAESATDTLIRICTWRQKPAMELRPEVPEALSSLIDQLLEKDPESRPLDATDLWRGLAGFAEPTVDGSTVTWKAISGAAILADGEATAGSPVRSGRRLLAPLLLILGVLAAAAALWVFRDRRELSYVAVLRPGVQSSGTGPGSDLVFSAVQAALFRSLLSLEGISPLAPEQVDPVPGSPVQVARATAADEVVSADLKCRGMVCQVSLRRIRGADGSLLWTETFEAPSEPPHLLAEAVEGYLRHGFPEFRKRPDASKLEIRSEDYEEFLRLRRSFEGTAENRSLDAIHDRLQILLDRSPRFVEGWVLQALVLRSRFYLRRNPADLEAALEMLRKARALAPQDPRPLLTEFEIAMTGEKLDAAEASLRELESLYPGDPLVAVRRASLLERRGEPSRALELMRDAAGRRPSYQNLFRLADMEFRLGEGPAAKRHVQEMLGRYPGYYQGRSLLAQIELFYGSVESAARIYSDLARRSPSSSGELTNLGTAQMLLRHYPQAEATFRKVLDREPQAPYGYLNLADVLLLQGKTGEAEDLYRRLLEMTQEAAGSPDWQILSLRSQAWAHLGDERRAVEEMQRVLRITADNAQATYEAALVYSVVGDHASALVNAEKALRQGIGARWFSFPWFDPLRELPNFRSLLASGSTSPERRRS